MESITLITAWDSSIRWQDLKMEAGNKTTLRITTASGVLFCLFV
jgi:hypothetical protein